MQLNAKKKYGNIYKEVDVIIPQQLKKVKEVGRHQVKMVCDDTNVLALSLH